MIGIDWSSASRSNVNVCSTSGRMCSFSIALFMEDSSSVGCYSCCQLSYVILYYAKWVVRWLDHAHGCCGPVLLIVISPYSSSSFVAHSAIRPSRVVFMHLVCLWSIFGHFVGMSTMAQ